MRELIVHDDRELRRIETAISTIEASSTAERLRRHCLLAALVGGRDELLHALGRTRKMRPWQQRAS
jgi:hypothetical protein